MTATSVPDGFGSKPSVGGGPAWILAAGVLWGVSAFNKKILLSYADPVMLNVLNSLSVCLTLVVVWTRPAEMWRSFRRFTLLYVGLGFFGTAVGTTLLYTAIDSLSLAVASVVGKLQPVFVIIIARLFLKERLAALEVVYSLLAISGAYLVAVPDPFAVTHIPRGTGLGLAAALASSIGWSISGVIGRHLSIVGDAPSPSQITFFRYLIGSIIVLPIANPGSVGAAQSMWDAPVPFVPTVFVLAFLTTTIPAWAYYRGLRTVSASYASILELSSPLTGVALGLLFLGERLDATQVAGIAIVMGSVLMLERRRMP